LANFFAADPMLNTRLLLLSTWIAMFGASACSNPRERSGTMDSSTQSRVDAGAGGITGGSGGAGAIEGAGGADGADSGRNPGTGSVDTTEGGVSVGQTGGSGGSPAVTPIAPVGLLSQYDNGCVIRDDSTLACWDRSLYASATITDYATGTYDSVIVDRFAASVDDACAHRTAGGYDCYPLNTLLAPPSDEYTQVTFGRQFACGLLTNGNVDCWGMVPAGTIPDDPFVQITGVDTNVCGLRADGTGTCWFDGTFATFPSDIRFRQISLAFAFMCGVTTDSGLVCWGTAAPTAPTGEPLVLSGKVQMVSGGRDHGCVLMEDGHVEALLNPEFDTRADNYQAPPSSLHFIAIDAGIEHDCGITTDGEVWCWGYDQPAKQMLGTDAKPISAKIR
jgi:hypothetical protein